MAHHTQPGPILPPPSSPPGSPCVSQTALRTGQTCSFPVPPANGPMSTVSQIRDTKQYLTSSCPPSHQGFLPPEFLTVPSCPPLQPFAQFRPLPLALAFRPVSTCSHPLSLPPSQLPQSLLLPGFAPATSCHLQWRSTILYPKSLKAHVLQNFPDFRKAWGIPTVT